MTLNLNPNIADADGFYQELVAAQHGMEDAEAERFLAKLVLILSNHVGDRAALSEAIALAKRKAQPAA